jgi:hypothetical protein
LKIKTGCGNLGEEVTPSHLLLNEIVHFAEGIVAVPDPEVVPSAPDYCIDGLDHFFQRFNTMGLGRRR